MSPKWMTYTKCPLRHAWLEVEILSRSIARYRSNTVSLVLIRNWYGRTETYRVSGSGEEKECSNELEKTARVGGPVETYHERIPRRSSFDGQATQEQEQTNLSF